MNGYIKLHRKILKWQWYGVPVVKDLFLHFLLRANLSDGFYNGTLVKSGQLVIGRKDLAETLGYTEMQIRGAIDKLRNTNEITTKTTNKGTIITIVNWLDYQDLKEENNQHFNHRVTSKQPANNHQVTTYKEEKEYKEIKEYINTYDQEQQSQLFEMFWKEYPRKIAKGKCFVKFKSICKDEPMFNKLMEGLKKQNELMFKYTEEQYIPHPFTWLNQERWNDEVKSSHEKSAVRELVLPDYYYETNQEKKEDIELSEEAKEMLRKNGIKI